MFFSIPDTSEYSGREGGKQQSHTLFNIYINEAHHCSVRYSQLRAFNEELQRLFPAIANQAEMFPPKKFFSLSATETNERRLQLEKYLQKVAQDNRITSSTYFIDFLLNAQRETFANEATTPNNNKLDLAIRLLNNHEIIIENINTNDSTPRLLDACAAKIQLKDDFLPYFDLYLYEHKNNQLNILRPLHEFEAPFLSLKHAKKNHEHACIVLKKSYWNPEYDLHLIDDRRARNLLFVQAQHEIEQSQTFDSSDIHEQLQTLRDSGSLKEFILHARTSKYYGRILLRDCSILYPITGSEKQKLYSCTVAVGNYQLICCLYPEESKKKASALKEVILQVTRIRCWKATRTEQNTNVALEYLIKKGEFGWITIHTKQASLLNFCLQNMVDEILAKKAGATSPKNVPTADPVVSQTASSDVANALTTRKESDLEKNNNFIFDGGDDDDL